MSIFASYPLSQTWSHSNPGSDYVMSARKKMVRSDRRWVLGNGNEHRARLFVILSCEVFHSGGQVWDNSQRLWRKDYQLDNVSSMRRDGSDADTDPQSLSLTKGCNNPSFFSPDTDSNTSTQGSDQIPALSISPLTLKNGGAFSAWKLFGIAWSQGVMEC